MILAIDQGTTGCTCIVFDERAEPVGRAYREFDQHFPQPGWVEHDAAEIWEVTRAVAGEALADAGVRPGELAAVGITNQRETVCVWDPATGRAAASGDRLAGPAHGGALRAAARGGARGVDPGAHRAGARPVLLGDEDRVAAGATSRACASARARAGRCSGRSIRGCSSSSRASTSPTPRTRRARCSTTSRAGRWDPELLELFGVPRAGAAARCARAPGAFGVTLPEALHGHAVPVAGVAGDQQAALFGQACVDPGMGKNTYGTGSFVLLNAGFARARAGARAAEHGGVGGRRSARTVRRPPRGASALPDLRADPSGTPRPATLPANALTYALEASIFVTGAAVQWLRDGLGIIADAAETEALAASLPSNEQVYFVPALTGLGSPHWDPHARGTIVGPHARLDARAPRARGAGGDRLPDRGRRARDGGRRGHAAARAARRRRRDGQPLADAVPGRHPRRAGARARGRGDHGARRRAAGRRRRRAVDVTDVRDGWRVRARYEPRMSEGERACLLAGWHGALAHARSGG